jgi:uncharacterized protein
MTKRTWLMSLSDETCADRLAHSAVGRLGVVIAGKPEVFPVCYVYTDGCVVFPTNEGTKMHSALEWPWVAFEIDGAGADDSSVWSVMITGQAEEVTDPATIERVSAMQTVVFRSHGSIRWIKITPLKVTGRQITVE